jgi:hypothetical protein
LTEELSKHNIWELGGKLYPNTPLLNWVDVSIFGRKIYHDTTPRTISATFFQPILSSLFLSSSLTGPHTHQQPCSKFPFQIKKGQGIFRDKKKKKKKRRRRKTH